MSLTEKEEEILNSISVRSYDDPDAPEFPPHAPQFPASPTVQIEVPGFENVWVKTKAFIAILIRIKTDWLGK